MVSKRDKMIENLNHEDKINLLWMAMNGNPQNAVYGYGEIKSYIAYIKAITSKKKISRVSSEKTPFDNSEKSKEFFEKYQAKVASMAHLTQLNEAEMVDLIKRIKAGVGKDSQTLTDNQYNFLYGDSHPAELRDYIDNIKLPTLTKIDSRTKHGKEILEMASQDKYFNDHFAIEAIFEPDFKRRKFPKKDGWKVMRGVHGTTNKSLLGILNGGFKLASQLRKDRADFKYMGSAFGDAIYFARLDQISKPINYMDSSYPTTYIIVADLYYKDKVDIKLGGMRFDGSTHYTGENLVHAHDAGRYNRDELMVQPNQIDIRYILQVGRK